MTIHVLEPNPTKFGASNASTTTSGTPDRSDRQRLLDEARLRLDIEVEGVRFDPRAIALLSRSIEEEAAGFQPESDGHDSGLQRAFWLDSGIHVGLRPNPRSPYLLDHRDGALVLHVPDGESREVELIRRHRVLARTISTGERFEQIASVNPEGGLRIAFSNECSLKDTNEDCKFCDFNHRARLTEGRSVFLKTPRQVAETFALAREEGTANHLNLTGGFIPERRELEYYLDAAEEIRELTGLSHFRGTAVIGAPADLKMLEKYKESGFNSVSINIEIWDKDIFKAICPGKERRTGGQAHWVAALEAAVEVFGRGFVKSNIVAGIEPKDSILEGVEYLASKGINCLAGPFTPRPGTALEGHRSPETSWHWDLQLKVAQIQHKYGYTTDQIYNCAIPGRVAHDLFRIFAGEAVDGVLPRWTYPILA